VAIGGAWVSCGGAGGLVGAVGVQAAKSITPNDKIILRAIKLLWFMVTSCINSRLLRATCTIQATGAFIEKYQLRSDTPLKKAPEHQ
jgi:hypothetical protein